MNGIFYILRTGAPWRDLRERYGLRTTVYNHREAYGLYACSGILFKAEEPPRVVERFNLRLASSENSFAT